MKLWTWRRFATRCFIFKSNVSMKNLWVRSFRSEAGSSLIFLVWQHRNAIIIIFPACLRNCYDSGSRWQLDANKFVFFFLSLSAPTRVFNRKTNFISSCLRLWESRGNEHENAPLLDNKSSEFSIHAFDKNLFWPPCLAGAEFSALRS